MLRYTGHPFVDIGLAALAAFCDKRQVEELTEADLERVAAYIEEQYVRPPLRGHLTMAFTANAWFIQDAFNPDRPELTAEKRAERRATRARWAAHHLRQWQDSEPVGTAEAERCIFTGLPAAGKELSGKLASGRIGRNQMPLLQGDDAINFFAYGDPGIPVSGLALLALQFFPLGCAKAGVGLLAVHSDNAALTYELVWGFLKQNLQAITQAQAAGEDKLAGAARTLKTLLIEALLNAQQRRQRMLREEQPASITAYNFNNGKSPQLQLYHLPLEIGGFMLAARASHAEAWERLVRRGWQLMPEKKGKAAQQGSLAEPRRNYLYEDLFDLPDQAPRFIRTYFLRLPVRTFFDDDPRRGYSLRTDLDLITWPLIELFLQKVMHMDAPRLAAIRTLGDRLAEYVRSDGGKRFFRAFFTENRPYNFRTLLIKANMAHVRAGRPPLFDMDGYIEVFEEGVEVMHRDWRLARDLVLMRMIDRLKDWLSNNPDAVPETDEQDAPVESTP